MMVKIFVAQTHEKDSRLVCEFLSASGFNDVHKHGTDPVSLTWLTRQMMFTKEPFALITSQRDMLDCNYIPNILQAAVCCFPIDTLTIVYTRAAAHQEHMPGVAHYFAKLISNEKHQLKIVPKISGDTRSSEYGTIRSYLEEFIKKIN